MQIILRKSDFSQHAIDLGIWAKLCNAVDANQYEANDDKTEITLYVGRMELSCE